MKNKIIDYSPLNFYKTLFWQFTKVLTIFIIAWMILYELSNESKKNYMAENFIIIGVIFFIVIAITILQTLFNRVYIYSVIQNGGQITIKWQELKLFKEITLPIENISVQLMPSGKNTPYLEVKLKDDSAMTILNQTYYPGWSRNTMESFMQEIKQIQSLPK